MSTPQEDLNDNQNSENQGESKLGNWFYLNRGVVCFVSVLILVLVGLLVCMKINDYKDEIRELEFSKKQTAKNASDEIQRERRKAEEYRKILDQMRSNESNDASVKKNNEGPNDFTGPNTNSKNGVIGLSGGQSGSMTVFVNGGNMNVSEINLGNGAKIDFSGMRWTGSIPTIVTNMVGSSEVGSVTQHKIGPYEDVVFEKTTTDIHATVWVSGRVFHDYLAAYNVGTANSPIWVEPTSSDKVTGVRIKSLGPELTVRFTVMKKP